MEKGTAHYKLPAVKTLIEAGKVSATGSAFSDARALGINDLDGMCAVVLALTLGNFRKSMTTYGDHRIWQDVYNTKTASGDDVYLKLSIIEDLLIVSFKEL
ncbi:MAG: type II toxin-antitoxin system MqsR family toxin [Betaproteobacteria bacterium]|nr:type II toxin-antitoxin system MqsR family toxin [Betaproteobacteria bacterium]